MFDILIISMATFGLAWLLVFEDGPFDVISRFRSFVGVEEYQGTRFERNQVGAVFNCPVCLSVWLSVPMSITGLLKIELLYPLVVIGIVVILSRYVSE